MLDAGREAEAHRIGRSVDRGPSVVLKVKAALRSEGEFGREPKASPNQDPVRPRGGRRTLKRWRRKGGNRMC